MGGIRAAATDECGTGGDHGDGGGGHGGSDCHGGGGYRGGASLLWLAAGIGGDDGCDRGIDGANHDYADCDGDAGGDVAASAGAVVVVADDPIIIGRT